VAIFVGPPEKSGRRIHQLRQITDKFDQMQGEKHMSIAMTAPTTGVAPMTCETRLPAVPCHVGDPDLWFAENPGDLERAKALCAGCPIRVQCLTAALERQEPWGVWGGEILDRGSIVARKRPRGRPRKDSGGNPAAA